MNIAIILVITNFLKTLFFILIIWYGIKLFTKYIVPKMLHRTVKNMQSKVEEQFRQQQRPNRPEGEVTIEKNPNQPNNKYPQGEYVDFEEVD
jgi:predicted membrane protein